MPILELANTSTAGAFTELYGAFHAMGVIVTTAAGDDPDEDATATVEYRTGSDPYRAGFPLSRVSEARFVGSLFWLQPATTYDVRVTFSDPDGGPLDGVTVTATRAYSRTAHRHVEPLVREPFTPSAVYAIIYVKPESESPRRLIAAL